MTKQQILLNVRVFSQRRKTKNNAQRMVLTSRPFSSDIEKYIRTL